MYFVGIYEPMAKQKVGFSYVVCVYYMVYNKHIF